MTVKKDEDAQISATEVANEQSANQILAGATGSLTSSQDEVKILVKVNALKPFRVTAIAATTTNVKAITLESFKQYSKTGASSVATVSHMRFVH